MSLDWVKFPWRLFQQLSFLTSRQHKPAFPGGHVAYLLEHAEQMLEAVLDPLGAASLPLQPPEQPLLHHDHLVQQETRRLLLSYAELKKNLTANIELANVDTTFLV